MPVSPAHSLIAPDNRLLGWGLTDLTLYGAQPLPGMTVGQADTGVVVTPAATPIGEGAAPAVASADAQALAPDLAGDASPMAAEPASVAPAAPTAFQPAPAAAPDAAPSVPLPVGSGTAVQPLVATPLQAVEQGAHGAPAELASPAVTAPADTVTPLGPSVAQALAPAATVLVPAATEVTGAAATILTDTTSGVAGAVGISLPRRRTLSRARPASWGRRPPG